MSKNSVTLGYLGHDFQIRLLAQILTDHRFGQSIIGILHPNYFDEDGLKVLMVKIKDAWDDSEIIPNYATLRIRIKADIKNEIRLAYAERALTEVEEVTLHDTELIQEQGMNFCKQQELKKVVDKLKVLIDKGDADNYDQAEEMIRKVLEIGRNTDDAIDVLEAIESVFDEDFRNPIPTGINGLDGHMNGGLAKGELAVILAPFGVGKAQPLGSKLLTPNGWTTMGEIKMGDKIITKSGNATKVTGVFPQGERPVYRVSFNDRTSTLCDEEHLWSVNTINQRNRKTKNNGKIIYLPSDDSFKTIKTIDMVNKVRVWGNRRLNFKVPIISPVNFNNKNVKIDPYLLGLILGDGCITENNQPRIYTKDYEIVESINNLWGETSVVNEIREIKVKNKLIQRELIRISLLGIKPDLIELDLYGKNSSNKFIPKDYLYNSIDNRVNLLQGLIDTDGSINSHRVEYTTVSKQLADDVIELVKSLGGRGSINIKNGSYVNELGVKIICKLRYRLSISFPDNNILPSRLTRKINNFTPRTKYSENKFISAIEFVGHEETQCIMVEDESHLYVTDDYIVTHNTTMITKIANSAMNLGQNVMQIFFEDMPKIIQRKHLACWSGINLNDLSNHKDELKLLVKEKNNSEGKIMLKKFPSDGTTMADIRNFIRQERAKGFIPDMILLDYIDCVVPSREFKNSWDGEGNVMRQFETLLVDFNVAGWTAVQGNRSSIKAEVVESDQMGGSIKRGQIGHFIISVAKSLAQKEEGTATLAILKSRFGKDGIIFYDVIFDNGLINIDVTEGSNDGFGMSMLDAQKNKEKANQALVNSVMGKKRDIIDGTNN